MNWLGSLRFFLFVCFFKKGKGEIMVFLHLVLISAFQNNI